MLKKIIIAASLSSIAMTGVQAQNKCKAGASQSPIDINGTESARTYPLIIQYNVTPLSLVNTGKGIKQEYGFGSKMKVGSKAYDLMQFHFHTPSEHTIMGKKFPAELHFVHGNKSKVWSVIGVMIKEGAANPAAAELLANLPTTKGSTSRSNTTMINARDLIPHDKSYYRYMGSLTTSPCSEGVSWYVIKQPIEMSKAQIKALSDVMGNNARPVQSRNFRLIVDTQSK